MIECFATWCGPCQMMIPHLAQMTKKYPNVYIVSVSQEDFGTVASFSLMRPQTREYNLAVDESGAVGQLMNRFGVTSIPHAFLINGKGELVWHGHPGQAESVLSQLNQEALQEMEQQKPQKQDNNLRTTVNFSALFKK